MELKPPKFFTRFFKWFCEDDLYEELQGDLEERFQDNVALHGSRRAKHIYRKEILKMLRPSVIRTPRLMSSITQLSLFRIHLKLALRNIYHSRLFSAFNIFGLGAALATSLFVVNMFYTAYQADKQHTDHELLYRIVSHTGVSTFGINDYATTPYLLAEKVANEIPEVEMVSQVIAFNFTLPSSIEDILINGIRVDSSFFKLFSFIAIDGNLERILNDSKSLIITDDIAERFFPDQNPIGQVTPQGFVIQAIVKSPKASSHIQFDAISGISDSYTPSQPLVLDNPWATIPYTHTYFKLKRGANIESLQAKLDLISEEIKTLSKTEKNVYDFNAQAVSDIMFGKTHSLELGSPLGYDGLKGFMILTTILLLLACFNYTNLSIARALKRTREIGIRKTVGSSRWQISGQFLTESVIFSLLALAIGYLIYLFFTPAFLSIDPSIAMIFSQEFEWQILVVFVVFAIIIGLLAGFFPALYFSRISPLSAFNSRVKSNPLSIINIRKGLVVLQITLSMFCIILVSLNASQNRQIFNTDLGFNQENVLILRADSLQTTRYRAALEQVPEVLHTTTLSSIPGKNVNGITFLKNVRNNDSLIVNYVFTDPGFAPLFKPELLVGSFFSSPGTNAAQIEALVNQKFLEGFNIKTDSIIGTVFKMKESTASTIEIKGVLKNNLFDNTNLSFERPLIIFNLRARNLEKYMAISIQMDNTTATLGKLEQAWNKSNPETDLQIEFLSEHLKGMHRERENTLELMVFLSTIVIGISLLGQLGMALYNAQTRIKEISVRKVLGAQLKTIITLLLRGTLISLIISTIIATPLAYLVFEESILENHKVDVQSGFYEYSRAILGLSAIVILVVISQTSRVANLSPTETLKND